MTSVVQENCFSDSLEKKFFDLVVHPVVRVEAKSTAANPVKHGRKLERRRPFDRQERRRLLVGNKKPGKKESANNMPLVDPGKQLSPLELLVTSNPSATVLQCRILQEVKDAEQKSLALKKISKTILNADACLSEDKLPDEFLSIPQVMELGLLGVFEVIRSTATRDGQLCCQALRSLLNMLQELKLQEMQDEPPQVLENLFQLLLDLSRLPAKALQLDDEATKEKNMPWPFSDAAPCTKTLSSMIPSIACSCLLSLVLAWGNTGKILSVIAAFVADCSNQEESLVVVVPPPFIALQKTVQAAILSKHHIPTPIELGINESSLFQSWRMEEKYTGLSLVSIQSDGSYLFCIFTNSLLLKVGSGYGSTVEGHIYGRTVIADFQSSSKSDQIEPKALFYFKGFLYVLATNKSFYLIDKSDFSVEHIGDAPSDEDIWFCDGVGLCCVVPLLNEDSHLIKCYDFGGDTLVLNNSIKVHPTKRHFLTRGKTLGYNPVKEPVAEKEHFEVVQVLLAADFSLCTTNKGQVYFAGKPEALGLNKTKSRKVTSPELLPIPTQSKINHIAVASDGDHAILITESGSVYFTGTAHRGEDGESSKGRRQQAQKPKLMKCMEGKHVLSGCCNSGGTSALVTKDGRLYLFGKDSSQADSKTGLVAALSDTQVKQVALGKAHVVVISNDGRLWTAGVNNRGQCGRQEGVMSITQRIAEVEQEKDVSMPDDKSMDDILASGLSGDAPIAPICSPDKHEFRRQICEICAVCCECTGYGSSCVYSSVEGRSPRNPCGCGAGWSGCSECGCCRTCAGEANVNPNEERKEEMRVGPGNGLYQPLNGRSPPSLSKLANLFHAQAHAQKRVTGSGSRDNKVPSKSDILKEANKMALLPLMQVRLPKEGDGSRKACQIACGDHHTVVLTDVGSVCVFGKNNHGQLGLGDTHNRNQPTRINLPHKVVKISAGSHHSILLTEDGLLFGCGSNAQGQLGPISNVDVLVPTLILPFQQVGSNVPRVSWVSATQTSTFIRYEEVLLNVTQLDQAKIFGTPEFFGISYQPDLPEDTNQKSHLLLIDRSSSHCQHYHQENVRLGANEQTCIDQANEVLWSFNASDWTVKSYLLCGYKNEAANQNLPFQPQLAIPMSLDLETTRTQAGLNLLSCINTLVTRCPNGLHFESKDEKSSAESSSSTSKATGKVSEPHTVDEYNIVSRFKSHGGGWGYSVHSTEAIRFMTDTDILLGGVGVFGGRGEYSVTVSVYEEVGDADVQGEGELLVETDQVPYECGFRERFHALFDEPVSIASNQWYTITCKVVGPSSDCGSHGEQNVTTSDNIKFTFRRSKWSNNGTDVSAGQIPELLYSLPVATPPSESEISMKPVHQAVVQKVSKSFYLSFNESAFESLPYILEWARTLFFTEVSKKSSRYDDPDFEVIPFEERQVSRTIENLSFIIPVCLRLLRVAINQCMAKSGGEALVYSYINQCVGLVDAILTDGEIDAALEDALLMPDFERSLVMSSAIAMITECHMIVTECIEAFHPSPPAKWAYLHRTLDNYNTAARVNKARMARLLTAVLDSFCQNSVDLVQCLPLFPRTLSNLASVMSPSADDAISTDASVANAGFYDVAYSLVEIACHPARVAVKIEKEYAVEKDHKSDIQQSKFSRMLFTSQKSIVSSACKLLSSLASDLAYRASDVSSHMKNIPLQKNFSSAMRFDGTDNNRSWNSGNGSPDATCFSVDLDDVYVGGFGVYGGGKLEHKYELEFLEQASASCDSKKGHWDTRDCVKGSYALKDCGPDHIVNIKLTKSFLLKKNVTYAVCLRNHGDRTYCGERGRATVVCNDGVTFHFTHCDQSTNGTSISRGQIPSILYHRSNQDEEFLASPIDKWVGTATTPVTAGLAYQRHALNILALVTESAVEILNSLTPDDLAEVKGEGSQESEEVQAEKTKEKEGAREVLTSELISHLLPGLFSNIGVLVRHNPHCAVEVMELIRNLLPPLINVQQILSPPFKNDLPLHSVVVESSHPYKPAQVSHYKASFPSSVKWMLIEFSSKCQTAQVEDSLRLFLSKTGNQAERRVEEKDKGRDILIPVLKKMSQDKNWPQNATVLPGHELFFQLHTASDYTNNKDKKPHLFYGFKCTVTGYEKVPLPKQQDGSFLVNELINVAGLASNTLMKVHEQLWNEDKDDLDSSNYNQNDKVDHLRAIETTAAVTLERHSSLFLPGLHLNFFPGSSQALNGTLPFSEGSKEKLFLYDFISAAPDTTGGRLARWLQPDSFVDPKQCLLHLNVKSLVHTLPASVTIITRDQYGKPVHVPTMKVELVAKPQPSSHLNNETGVSLDISPTDPSPVFEAKFEVTKHRDSRYQTITMMRPYKKYSFEELRLAYPHKQTFKSQNILVASVGGGTYRATWIPALAATYTLQVTLDQQLRGPRQLVVVSPAPLGCSEPPRNSPVSTLIELTSKMLRFATRNSRGLRIRSHPTLQSPQIGLLEYDDIIECCQEVHNNDGDWVKLSKTSIEKYCKENTNEAWCISFHKHNSRTFLLPVDVETSRAKENDKKDQPKPVLESVTQLIPPVPPLRTSGKPSTSNIIPPPQAVFSLEENPFTSASTPGHSKIFSSPFATPTQTVAKEWVEKVPGEYTVKKCGSSGHNIRYNPSKKAAPLGKLVFGNTFMAAGIKRNTSGIWLLLHRAEVSQFCEESPDEGHAWALAVSVDGTQHLSSVEGPSVSLPLLSGQKEKSKMLQEMVTPTSSTNANNLAGKDSMLASAIRGAAFAKLTNPFQDSSSGGSESEVVDLLVASLPGMIPDAKLPAPKAMDVAKTPKKQDWKARVKRHHRSSSDSDAMMPRSKANSLKYEAGRGRVHRSLSQRSPPSRSHSIPNSKPRSSSRVVSSSRVKAPPRKTLVERQSLQHPAKYPGTRKKTPSEKILCGGKKKEVKDDIPFIDDVIDAEGNILSSGKSDEDKKGPGKDEEEQPSGTRLSDLVNQIKMTPPTRRQPPLTKLFSQQKTPGKVSDQMKSKKSQSSSQALSPLVAECARAVFAAFLWHEGIVHDAMACASFLKFNLTARSQVMKFTSLGTSSSDDMKFPRRRASEQSADEKDVPRAKLDSSGSSPPHPPDTLLYLAMFWDQLSDMVTKIAIRNQNLPLPTPVNQNLNCHSEKPVPPAKNLKLPDPEPGLDRAMAGNIDLEQYIRLHPLKRKPFQRNNAFPPQLIGPQARRNLQPHAAPYYHQAPVQGNIVGADPGDHFKDTRCDLCDKVHPFPITYHMKQAHPGCGKFAGGVGYNSSGNYCGGWAGDCGDGGVGGSTWYLLCLTCRHKYMSMKSVVLSSEKQDKKSNGSWMTRLHALLTQPTNAHQVMKDNAMFLLNLKSASSGTPQLYEQQNEWNKGSATFLEKETDMVAESSKIDDEGIWEKTVSAVDLLPQSKYTHCPFPAIPCSYLAMHGKENGINNNIRPNQLGKMKGMQDYQNRSLSNPPSSGQLRHVSQRLSITPDSSPHKTEMAMYQRNSRLMRSVSTGSQPQRRRTCSGGDASPMGISTGSFLLHNPSAAMKKLMCGQSGNSNDIARDAVQCSYVLPFVTQRHDLKSLHLTMQMTLRRAALRVYVLQALTWLLRTVVSESAIHDILWYFVAALTETAADSHKKDAQKSVDGDVTDDDMEETKSLYVHPVKDIANAGIDSMQPLVEAFHGFLQTVSDIMMDLPPNSPVQLMAIRCWSLRVLPSDHQFLHQSKVFSHISQILSKVDSKAPSEKKVKLRVNQKSLKYVPVAEASRHSGKVYRLRDLSLKVQIKTSSHTSIANSLTDGSTETFWESGDEDKNKSKNITIDFAEKKDDFSKIFVHIDNTRDVQKKVTSVAYWVESNEEWNRSNLCDINTHFVGWLAYNIPEKASKVKMELRGPDNGLRVRQVKILGDSAEAGEDFVEQLPANMLRAQTCESELLKVFKLLTAEVFGRLLSDQSSSSSEPSTPVSNKVEDKVENNGNTSVPPSPREVDPNLREHMVGILFSRSKLTSLQKKVFDHTVQAIHTEAARIKLTWQANLEKSAANLQLRTEENDVYCFELLSMLLALSGSDVGCHYVAQQNPLINDFISLLHTGTPRIQRQVTLLLRRILSEVTPNQLASILSTNIPCQDKLSNTATETPPQTSTSSTFDISVLDPLFACIAKSLSVQVKGTPEPAPITGEGDASATIKLKRHQTITLQSQFNDRPELDHPAWWMHGSIQDRSIVEAIIRLLSDMSAGKISTVWEIVTKCSVSEAILSLMKLTEAEREAGCCLRNRITWQALAALCVLDHDHVEKLSSARSSSQKNKLHRFLALQDKERTHIFTFLVENPQEISSFDVRSREFQFAGHRWYVYTGKPNNEYFSFYLRIVNLGKDVRVHTVYSFNVVNLVNYQNNYTYHSPPTGRVFSRDDDALSWGWKEFIRRETLLKPNGGFFFDGNKVLVELECKAYKTVFEENVELPKVEQENPYPMVHTSPFSVGGFAWQIRIFPDGPDVENRGNVALFLHCTTSNHLAKIKARFLIEGQPSPTVYEHTFPPNSISEMPSGVAFPNKGEFMKSLKENQLRVGVEFMSVTEVNEVHVTLSEPNSCPTVCVTPFEDLSGCPWVLKTLQAVKLKLKMDQNEKTTSGLMEFYHRHVMWNATLVSPGTEDVSLNVALNTKGPLIGYFGENWSDADVIKSDLAVEDLALTDNPYRTDVDDGYDRYSYVSIHVEIVSNHLLYKTPTPSPTGDRERKLLYSARKDRTQVHARYQELLRQKALLASKCQNLTRERTRLIGDEKNDVISQIVPDFSKFLSDVMLDLSQRAASKGRLQARETRVGRPYKATPQLDETERQKKLADYRENFSLLLSDARPNLSELAVVQQYMGEFKEILTRFIEAKAAIHVSGVITSGSLGTNTTCSNRWDIDFVLLSSDLPRIGHVMWMPSFVVALAKMLEEGAIEGKLPDCSNFTYTNYSVQFKHKEVEVDILPAYDWQHEGGFDALYEELLRQRTSENLTWFCPAAAQRQKLFIEEQPDQVKDLIMVVKFWRNAADWNERKWRPTSYLLALLLIRAYENACHVVEGSLPSNKTVMKSFVKLILSTGNPRPAPMRIAWSRFYDPKDYNIEYSGSMSGECPPIVQDPANPANNVAEMPVSWLPFRRMLEAWAHDLGLMESPSLTCDNHDDGSTPAIVLCNECGNLCSECDRYLHLHKRTLSHQRQVFKEEEEAIRVNLHEGCGRIKLFWFMALADANTLKAIVEFKSRAPGGQRKHVTTGTGVCRFCGRSSDDGQLAVGNVCSDPACQQHAARACTRTHQCGHLCGGVKDEESCLPCLQPSCNPALNQDADDMCMVCFTDALAAAPAVQLDCGHIFHYSCCEMQLQKQWAGPRITFSFMHCSICKCEIKHPSLDCYLAPLRDLVREVERKALQRLEYEGLNECESITAIGGRFFNDRVGFALSKYAYYMCCKCKKAYYGGEVRCDAEAGGADLFDPQELICGACSDISCAQICPKHGTDFLEYKCRYCCSVAVYFCFGTTHFCQPCHDDFQRITALPKSDLPHCPAGHKTRQLEGEECPLHVVHPPTGEEFALGCGVCRNAHTF